MSDPQPDSTDDTQDPSKENEAGKTRSSIKNTVDFTVPGIVRPIRQPNNMACWATAATMMVGWREARMVSIEMVLAKAGQSFLDTFKKQHGISGEEKRAFLSALGFTSEPPQCYAVEAWERALRSYGALWITTDEAPGNDFAIHSRILTGIHGDGSDTFTMMDITDPATGTAYQESLADMSRKFEKVGTDDLISGGTFRAQVVHF